MCFLSECYVSCYMCLRLVMMMMTMMMVMLLLLLMMMNMILIVYTYISKSIMYISFYYITHVI